MLPSSFLARRHLTADTSTAPAKERKVSQQVGKKKVFTKDIVCLPHRHYPDVIDDAIIPIPRGKARGNLAELGLIKKVRLVSTCSAARVTEEITKIFSFSFGFEENQQLKFKYLSVVPGAKVLSTAKVSSSFLWNGHAVASLVGHGCIYILSEMQLIRPRIEVEPGRILSITIDTDSEQVIEVHVLYCQTG